MSAASPPPCDLGECPHRAHYLLGSGDLCTEHALESEPKTVNYLRKTVGIPDAAREDPTYTVGEVEGQ